MANNIIEELNSYLPRKNKHQIVEDRARHLIQALINLKEDIKNKFSDEEAEDLVNRINLAVRNNNPEKFTKKIRSLKEATIKKPKFLED